jgi:hypothetical protein
LRCTSPKKETTDSLVRSKGSSEDLSKDAFLEVLTQVSPDVVLTEGIETYEDFRNTSSCQVRKPLIAFSTACWQ